MEVSLFSQATSGRMKGYGHKLCQGRFSLNIKMILFTQKFVRNLNRLPEESAGLEESSGVALSAMV